MPLLLHDPTASLILGASAVAIVVGEVGATYLGQARDGERRPLGSLVESLFLVRRRGGVASHDRGTKWIVAVVARVGILAGLAIAVLVPGLRVYANDWPTFGLGIALVLAGVLLRAWAIVTLGRYFRREPTPASC
ncbi:MAG TPA: hypothetical protein VGI72_10005 [Gaiellales bacterium]|jgi:hypothetical protein